MKIFSWSPLAWARVAIMSAQKEERKVECATNWDSFGTNWEIVSLIGMMTEHAHRVFEEPALLDVSSPVAILIEDGVASRTDV